MPVADCFLDTNILIYAISSTDPAKHKIALGIVSNALATRSAVISTQVIQECLSVLTGKLEAAAPGSARTWLTNYLMPLCAIYPTEELYLKALDLKQRYQLSFYDSLIVAAALQSRVSVLLTEDLQHGQTIEGLTIQNPFLSVGRG